jgi:hypothetical protein
MAPTGFQVPCLGLFSGYRRIAREAFCLPVADLLPTLSRDPGCRRAMRRLL